MPVDTPAWARDAVFYQIFPDRFAASPRVPKPGPLEPWDASPTNHGFKGGDLLGIVEHLDHVAALGCNALYLNPIFQSASNHRYHTYDYLAVDTLLGGDEALGALLDAAHARGIRVVLDGVFNHTGRGFWPFHHVLENGGGSPYRGWFHFDQAALDRGVPIDAYPEARVRAQLIPGDHPGDHSTVPGGTGDSTTRLGYQAWWDMPALPKLNLDEPAVRELIWSVAEHWLRRGIDGWRLDVPGEIQDPPFWAEFRRRCRAMNPEAYLVGEIWDVAPDWVSGDRFDALMNYPLAEAVLGFVAGESLNEALLRAHHEYSRVERLDGPAFGARLKTLLEAYDPAVVAVQLNLLGSHDTPRALSILGGDRRALELAVLLQATLPGAPCVYYGDEIGTLGGMDPDNRRGFRWDEATWDRELRDWTARAFALRHAEPLLRGAGGTGIVSGDGRAMAFERADPSGRLAVALNPGPTPVAIVVARQAAAGRRPEILLGHEDATARPVDDDGDLVADLPARSGLVVRVP
ncbi:MAG TPA: glycoside hydrolase family 13 protein [Candidatus Limnocylindrales bacterium]|nr:glycoside hydrolase family 13 protein [Candidatus Limnocylindrales bacterium]